MGAAGIAWLVYSVFSALHLQEFKTFGVLLAGAGIPAIIIVLTLLLEQAMVDHTKPTPAKLLLIEGIILIAVLGLFSLFLT